MSKLSNYFMTHRDIARKSDELPYLLHRSGDLPRLKDCLCDIDIFTKLYNKSRKYELKGYIFLIMLILQILVVIKDVRCRDKLHKQSSKLRIENETNKRTIGAFASKDSAVFKVLLCTTTALQLLGRW